MANMSVASACSCADGDPREAIEAADAAIVGVVRVASAQREDDEPRYRIEVEKPVKGSVGKVVTVHSTSDSTSCGLMLEVGSRNGLLLRRHGDRWVAGLCNVMDPDRLLAAGEPLVPAERTGPVAFVAAGGMGAFRTIAMDAAAQPVAFGRGEAAAERVDVCPGGRLMTEVAAARSRGPRIVVRDVRTQRVKRTIRLRDFEPEREWQFQVRSATCNHTEATEILVFVTSEGRPDAGDEAADRPRDAFVRIAGGRQSVLWSGRATDARYSEHSGDLLIALADPPSLVVRRSDGDGGLVSLVNLPRPGSHLAVSSDGAYAALFVGAYEPGQTAELWIVHAATGAVARAVIGDATTARAVVWATPDVVTVAPIRTSSDDTFESFAVDGTLMGRWRGWPGFAIAVSEGRVHGIDRRGRMFSADAVAGNPLELGRLNIEGLRALDVVSGSDAYIEESVASGPPGFPFALVFAAVAALLAVALLAVGAWSPGGHRSLSAQNQRLRRAGRRLALRRPPPSA